MKEIIDFLKSPDKDYAQGAALYAQHGKNKNLIAVFLRKPNGSYNKKKLVHELTKMVGEVKEEDNPIKGAIKTIKSLKGEAKAIKGESATIIEELLNNRMAAVKKLLKERDMLYNSSLSDATPEGTREYAALRVKDISVNILEDLYGEIDQLKKGIHPYEDLTDTQVEAKYRNAQKALSKANTKDQKVNILRWEMNVKHWREEKERRGIFKS